jgi:hypothetical protein
MIDTLSKDQELVWIKDPVQDIINSMTLPVFCITYCSSKDCKVYCLSVCTIYFQ